MLEMSIIIATRLSKWSKNIIFLEYFALFPVHKILCYTWSWHLSIQMVRFVSSLWAAIYITGAHASIAEVMLR